MTKKEEKDKIAFAMFNKLCLKWKGTKMIFPYRLDNRTKKAEIKINEIFKLIRSKIK